MICRWHFHDSVYRFIMNQCISCNSNEQSVPSLHTPFVTTEVCMDSSYVCTRARKSASAVVGMYSYCLFEAWMPTIPWLCKYSAVMTLTMLVTSCTRESSCLHWKLRSNATTAALSNFPVTNFAVCRIFLKLKAKIYECILFVAVAKVIIICYFYNIFSILYFYLYFLIVYYRVLLLLYQRVV